jgi:hypothetical protein
MADEKNEGTEYRVLADAMLHPEPGNNRRLVKGDKVWIKDDRKADSLLRHGGIVKEADASDEQKKAWESNTESAERTKADREAISKMEKEYAAAGGKNDNRTASTDSARSNVVTKPSAGSKVAGDTTSATENPSGAPKQAK